MATIGFLGPRGTFTEGAARAYLAAVRSDDDGGARAIVTAGAGGGQHTFGGSADTGVAERVLKPFDDIPELLSAVQRGAIEEAIVPVENSIEGTVNVTLDMLVHDVQLTIVHEIVLPIRHHLLVRAGAEAHRVRTVVSHPQALAQCRRYIETNLPGVTLQAALSTAAAAAQAGAAEDGSSAAIGNALCAELYGLTIIASDIQDESTNATRFFAVRRAEARDGADVIDTGVGRREIVAGVDRRRLVADVAIAVDDVTRYKTSIAFAFAADGPGNLYGALGEFARHDVNLTKLESRPARQALGHYIFLVDVEGHTNDASVAKALDALKRECTFVKILGSYRRAPYTPVTPRPTSPPGEPPDSRSL